MVLIVSDGLRWQEVSTGAEADLLNDKEGGSWLSAQELRKRYWRENPDDAIDSNEFGPNPNATVFEWLNKDPEFRGRVAIYGTWTVYGDIFNRQRSGLVMQTGWTVPKKVHATPRDALLREMIENTTRFDEEDLPNSLLQVPLIDYVKTGRPRVLFVGYGETDNWAHQGRYDLVLDSAHRFDHFVKQLWDTMQAMPQYHGTTTFMITTDHGRGGGFTEWKEHGVEEQGSQNIWLAVMGPDTEPPGERTRVPDVVQAKARGARVFPIRRGFYIILMTLQRRIRPWGMHA